MAAEKKVLKLKSVAGAEPMEYRSKTIEYLSFYAIFFLFFPI